MSRKHSIEYIREYIENEGWVLRSKEYIDAHTKLDCVCPNGHKVSIRWYSFKSGIRCPKCSGVYRYNIDEVRDIMEPEGFIVLSTEYVNNKTKLEYLCPNDHINYVRFNDWLNGHKCSECSGTKKKTIEYVKEQFWSEMYIVTDSVYINKDTKLNYICPNGHQHSITYRNWMAGCRCPTCASMKTAIRMTGEGNPNWNGGSSSEQYCLIWSDKEYKLDLKERDGFRCQNPYCSCNGGVLCLHHIDYDKFNCHPSNLIVLCSSCHSYSNANREWHTAWYQTLMAKKYGYVY